MSDENFKSGFVSLIGAPNAGKSTLLNTLLKQKLSIVSRKPQTTRQKIVGILTDKNYQIVFLDTPGIIEPKYLLHEVMMKSAINAVNDSDIIAVLIDAKNFESEISKPELKNLLEKISKTKIFLLINKIDTISKNNILPMISMAKKVFKFDEIIPISGLENLNTNSFIEQIEKNLPIHQPYFPIDEISDTSEKFFVSEIIREKIFKIYKKEIPYSTTVQIVEFKEREKGKFFIHAEIFVERNSQKGIIVGNKGLMLKKIGEYARNDIEKFLHHKIFLKLFVKVKTDWKSNSKNLKEFGYN